MQDFKGYSRRWLELLIKTDGPSSSAVAKARNIAFVLIGVTGLLLKRHYAGPCQELVHAYGGNFAVSFAVYFVAANLPLGARMKRLVTAGLALAAVDLFEAFDGFGIMANVYDPIDFLANAAGIAFAWIVDTVLVPKRRSGTNSESPQHPADNN